MERRKSQVLHTGITVFYNSYLASFFWKSIECVHYDQAEYLFEILFTGVLKYCLLMLNKQFNCSLHVEVSLGSAQTCIANQLLFSF